MNDRAFVRLRRAERIVPLLVALATCLVFSGALRNRFVNWDDFSSIARNPHLRGLGGADLLWMFSPSSGVTYAPLVWLLFSLTRLVWGLSPLGFHLTGILVHVSVAVVLYHTTLCLLQLGAPAGDGEGELVLRWSAGLAALLFSLHPLRVEAVAWASSLHHELGSLFFLVSIWSYLKSIKARRAGRAPSCWLAASLFGYLLSLLSGPMGVTLPAVLMILDLYLAQAREGGWKVFDVRSSLSEKAPFLILAALAGLATLRGRVVSGHFLSIAKHGVAERFSQAMFGLSFYLWKTIAPFGLSPLYPLPHKIDPLAWPILLSGACVALITAAAFALRRRRPSLLAAWAFYIIALAPVLGFVQFGPQIAADRYAYLPSFVFAVLSAGGLYSIWKKKGPRAWRNAAVIVGVLLAALGFLTWRQVKVWRDSETLWRYALSLDPDLSVAHADLGDVLFERGQASEAIAQYESALAADPSLAGVHNNLGYALAGQGKIDEAIVQYNLALDAEPGLGSAHNNLALALAGQGKYDEAVRHFEAALRAQPDRASTHYSLGVVLLGRGRDDDAIAHFRRALELDPGLSAARARLGLALRRGGAR